MAKIFRRLALEQATLHTSPPASYVIPESSNDDLRSFDAILVGPTGTPYEQGAFRLTIKFPEDYPQAAPKANFKTKIWHPNVEEKSGEVCVDILKTGWESKITLKDILDTIKCLLIHPNPSSALNSEAGLLCDENYKAFSRQAKLMTKIHASIPEDLKDAVKAMRQKAEEVQKTTSPGVGSSKGKKAISPKRKSEEVNEPSTLSIPQDTSSTAQNNALHTPTKDKFTNSAVHHPVSHQQSSHTKGYSTSSVESTRIGKENNRSGVSPCGSRSSSPLGKRSREESEECENLGEDLDTMPPPPKRRSLDLEERPMDIDSVMMDRKPLKPIQPRKILKKPTRKNMGPRTGLRRL